MRRLLVLLVIVVAGIVAGAGSPAVGVHSTAGACASGKALGNLCYPPCPLFPNWSSSTSGAVAAGSTSDGSGLTAKCVFAPASSLCEAAKGSCPSGSTTPPVVTLTFLVTFAAPSTSKPTVQGCSPAAAVSGTTATLSSYGQVANIQVNVDGSEANAVLYPGLNGAAGSNVNDVEPNILGNARAYLDAFNFLDKSCNAVPLRFAAPLPPNPAKLSGRTAWPIKVTGGSAGSAITISGSTPKVCAIVRSRATVSLHLIHAGTCTVVAHQGGAAGSVPVTAGISFKVA